MIIIIIIIIIIVTQRTNSRLIMRPMGQQPNLNAGRAVGSRIPVAALIAGTHVQ